jgi:hypothetical protein
MTLRLVIVGLVVMAFAAAGCGDDDDAAGGVLSREEYVAEGDEICRELLDAGAAFRIPESPEDLEELLRSAIEVLDATSRKLAGLVPPADAALVHAALRNALDGGLAKLRQALLGFEGGNIDATIAALSEAQDIGDDSDQAAKDYGFQVCGSEEEIRSGSSS